MVEILPLSVLTDSDSPIYGSLNVSLGQLGRSGLPVGNGIVITAPNLHLKTILEHYDFKSKEVFEQTLTLIKKEINSTPVPEILRKEVGKHSQFLLDGKVAKSVKDLWFSLLEIWVEEIKVRIWKDGFYKGITEELEPQAVFFVKKVESLGNAFFDPIQDDTVINVKTGKLHPNDLKKIHDLVGICNKKLFIPHEYDWIIDGGVKLVGLKPFTQSVILNSSVIPARFARRAKAGIHTNKWIPDQVRDDKVRSTVKIFLDLSKGLVVDKEVDGVFIASEKIFDLNTPRDSFENLVLKLVASAITFPSSPILLKLADKSEGMGKIRGTLRLLHQQSLLKPMLDALDFVRHKKGLLNIHPVIPFVRSYNEFLQIKRELAVKKLGRKNSLQLWMEIAVPENIINLEEYLVGGLDGIVLNLDELIAYLNGFDHTEEVLTFYKNEVDGLLKFLDDGLKIMHKAKVPFIAYGNLTMNPKVLDFLIKKGVMGMVVERYEVPSIHDLLRQAEKRMILRKFH